MIGSFPVATRARMTFCTMPLPCDGAKCKQPAFPTTSYQPHIFIQQSTRYLQEQAKHILSYPPPHYLSPLERSSHQKGILTFIANRADSHSYQSCKSSPHVVVENTESTTFHTLDQTNGHSLGQHQSLAQTRRLSAFRQPSYPALWGRRVYQSEPAQAHS